jgi:hypothetical protein
MVDFLISIKPVLIPLAYAAGFALTGWIFFGRKER